MWSSCGRRVLQELLSQPAARSFSVTAVQNTVVVERWWQVPLSKVGSPPRLNPRRHRIYKLVEDSKHSPKEKMELILTQTVPKLGGRGDTVFVKKSVGRNKLLPEGLAVYPSPENKQMFAEELRLLREGRPEDRIQTRTGQMTLEFLKSSKLKIIKMPSDEFQLTKEVIIRQFAKRLGVVVPLRALNFPFEAVKDLGEYWCEVTVNGLDTVRIPILLLPYEDMSACYQRQKKSERKQQAAAEISEADEAIEGEEEKDAVLNAVPDTVVEIEAAKDLASAGSSAAEGQAAPTQTEQDTTAPTSESPDKK